MLTIRGRYGLEHTLVKKEEGVYVLCLDGNCLTYRVIGDPNHPEAIDPEGGPMIGIGGYIPGHQDLGIVCEIQCAPPTILIKFEKSC